MYKLVKTTLPHKVYLVRDGVVMHDTRGVPSCRQSIIDATLEALNLPGSIHQQLGGDGIMLQRDRLLHVQVASINPSFYVSSYKGLQAEDTRGIVRAFLEWEEAKK